MLLRLRSWWPLALVLAVAAAVRLPVLLSNRDFGFDDGVFGLSARAMRDGYLPFKDVFSSQGPLFLPLVWVADLVGLRTPSAPRLLAMASGLVVAAAVYGVVRRRSTRAHAFVAAALVALAGSVVRVTGPLLADGVALALAVLALAAAVAFADRPSRTRAVMTGAVAAAAVAVKLLVAPVGLAVAACFLARDRRGYLGWAALGASVVSLACWLPFGIGDVVAQSVSYHQEAATRGDLGQNANEVISVLRDQDPTVFLAVVGCLAVALVQIVLRLRRRWTVAQADGDVDLDDQAESEVGHRRWWPLDDRVVLQVGVWAWLGATLVFLLLEPTLWQHHVAIIVPPLVIAAVLLVRRPAVLLLVGALTLVALPVQIEDAEPILRPEPYDADEQAAIDRMADLPDDAWIVTDAPGLVWAAGLSAPPELVDPSVKRIEQDLISLSSLRTAVQDPRVCGALAWRPKFGWLVPGLPTMLKEEGFVVALQLGPITNDTMAEADVEPHPGVNTARETLWLRPDCDLGG